jgi:ferredoxin-NADP reductase
MTDLLNLRVEAMRREAEGILSVELRDPDGAELPPFTAGSHLDLVMPTGITRSYSLLGDPAERHRYVIGVGLDPNSRGGSRYVHDRLRVGQPIAVAGPRNAFPLAEDAPLHVLVGGGIGVTPMLAMGRRLAALGREFHFYYAVRDVTRAAFLGEMTGLGWNLVSHVDAEKGAPLDLAAVVAAHPGAHFYCCGPTLMLDAFETATSNLPEDHVHLERFAPKVVADGTVSQAFSVECRKSGVTVEVATDRSIADVLEKHGIAAGMSCQEGICGACETRVLSGEPEHRDSVLSKSEQASGRTMMICVSRCKGERLVLDI